MHPPSLRMKLLISISTLVGFKSTITKREVILVQTLPLIMPNKLNIINGSDGIWTFGLEHWIGHLICNVLTRSATAAWYHLLFYYLSFWFNWHSDPLGPSLSEVIFFYFHYAFAPILRFQVLCSPLFHLPWFFILLLWVIWKKEEEWAKFEPLTFQLLWERSNH